MSLPLTLVHSSQHLRPECHVYTPSPALSGSTHVYASLLFKCQCGPFVMPLRTIGCSCPSCGLSRKCPELELRSLIYLRSDMLHKSPSDRVDHATLRGFLNGAAYCTLHAGDRHIKLFETVARKMWARRLVREAEKFGFYGKPVCSSSFRC